MSDKATEAILAYNNSLTDENGNRNDIVASMTITIYSGGGGSFSSDGSCNFTCGTIETKTENIWFDDFTDEEMRAIKQSLENAIVRAAERKRRTESKERVKC